MKWKQLYSRIGSAGVEARLIQSVCRREWCGLWPMPPAATAPVPSPLASGSPRVQPVVLWELLTTDPGIWEVGRRTRKLLTGGLGYTHRGPVCVNTHRMSVLLFSRAVVSDSLQPHGLQHARPPCPSPSPGFCDAIHPSHPLTSSSPALDRSQHQGLFQ